MANNKVAVISICSVLLLAMVVAVTINISNKDASHNAKSNVETKTSTKAIKDICRPTDYKQTCEKSLTSEAGNSTDPKELIKVAFKVTEKEIQNAVMKSTTIQNAAKDPATADAFKICKEVLGDARDDLYRSISRFNISDISRWDDYAYDIKIWLSGTVACQETCLDGFENTTGDTGEKMKQLLKKSRELTVNALAIIDDLSKTFESLTGSHHRRLLSDETEPDSHRSTLCRMFSMFCDPDDSNPFEDPEDPYMSAKRRLLSKRKRSKHNSDIYDLFSAFSYSSDDPKSKRRQPQPNLVRSEDAVDGIGRRRLLSEEKPSQDLIKNPNVIVAQDGSGKYKTIGEAIKDIPRKGADRFVIYIKTGTYNESVLITNFMTNVVMIGDGPTKTRITGKKSVVHDGLRTYHTATVGVDGFGFIARDIGFENTAGHTGEQAVALRVSSDQSVFHNCHIDGYQDTLYAHVHRQFYRDCKISGTIDFLFGDAAAVFQNCTFEIRKPGENQACMVTAQGRKFDYEPTGFVLQNCNIKGDSEYLSAQSSIKSYLGRPWKDYAKTIVIHSNIDSVIQPQGWEPWPPNLYVDTCWYSEYENSGPSASLSSRVKWKGFRNVSTREEAEGYTPGKFLKGDEWIPATGIPYISGMMTAGAPATSSASAPAAESASAPTAAPAAAPSTALFKVGLQNYVN